MCARCSSTMPVRNCAWNVFVLEKVPTCRVRSSYLWEMGEGQVSAHICIYIYIYIHMKKTNKYTYTYTCTFIHICIICNTRTYIHRCIFIYICTKYTFTIYICTKYYYSMQIYIYICTKYASIHSFIRSVSCIHLIVVLIISSNSCGCVWPCFVLHFLSHIG